MLSFYVHSMFFLYLYLYTDCMGNIGNSDLYEKSSIFSTSAQTANGFYVRMAWLRTDWYVLHSLERNLQTQENNAIVLSINRRCLKHLEKENLILLNCLLILCIYFTVLIYLSCTGDIHRVRTYFSVANFLRSDADLKKSKYLLVHEFES